MKTKLNLNEQDKIVLALAAGVLITPVTAALSYGCAFIFGKISGRKKRRSAPSGSLPVSEYNQMVLVYNTTVTHFNRELEERMDEVPRLRELVYQIDQDQYNKIFEEMMKEEF